MPITEAVPLRGMVFPASSSPPERCDTAMSAVRSDSLDIHDLHDVVDPRHAVEMLRKFGLTEQDLADATGANTRTVRRWKSAGAGNEPTQHARQIDDLRTLVARMAATGAMTDRAVVHWLRARNRWLNDERPLDALSSDDQVDSTSPLSAYKRVRAAADLFVDPNAEVPEGFLPARAHHPHPPHAHG